MAIVTNEARTPIVQTRAGIQPKQYASQLRKAGLLDAIYLARGAHRLRLERAANELVRDLRAGRINETTKQHAAKLGLCIYPEGTPL